MRMDQQKTGILIRALRLRRGMTQLALAGQIGVGDKAVSKWERGGGAPDIGLLPSLAAALGVDPAALLKGELDENDMSNGNLRKMRFYVCPSCGNLLWATDDAEISCCGQKLPPLTPRKPDPENMLTLEKNDGQWFVSAAHEMRREHYVSFVAFLNGDTMIVRKLYPEWNLETRLPFFAHGLLLWYCTRDGLFYQGV